jgi:hypothetical protein
VIGRGRVPGFRRKSGLRRRGRRKCGSGGSTARDKGESGRGRVENKGGKKKKKKSVAGSRKVSWVRERVRGRVSEVQVKKRKKRRRTQGTPPPRGTRRSARRKHRGSRATRKTRTPRDDVGRGRKLPGTPRSPTPPAPIPDAARVYSRCRLSLSPTTPRQDTTTHIALPDAITFRAMHPRRSLHLHQEDAVRRHGGTQLSTLRILAATRSFPRGCHRTPPSRPRTRAPPTRPRSRTQPSRPRAPALPPPPRPRSLTPSPSRPRVSAPPSSRPRSRSPPSRPRNQTPPPRLLRRRRRRDSARRSLSWGCRIPGPTRVRAPTPSIARGPRLSPSSPVRGAPRRSHRTRLRAHQRASPFEEAPLPRKGPFSGTYILLL